MLPPVDQAVVSTNPRFDALYRDLCTNKLNPDGTSRLDGKAQHDREALGEELRKARIEASKRDLIRSGLEELSYQADELPDELQELVAVVFAVLEGNIADDDRDLLQDDLAKFKDNIKPITAAISKQLRQNANIFTTTLDTDQRIPVQSLSVSVDKLKTSIAISRSALSTSRLALAQEVSTLHVLYRQAIETSICILEQTMHGSVARGAKAKADYLAAVAEGMSKKLSLQHGQLLSQLYSSDVQEVLKAKSEDLDRDVKSTKRKVREAEERLEEYREAGGILGVAQEYAEILKETEKVKAEISRLEGRAG